MSGGSMPGGGWSLPSSFGVRGVPAGSFGSSGASRGGSPSFGQPVRFAGASSSRPLHAFVPDGFGRPRLASFSSPSFGSPSFGSPSFGRYSALTGFPSSGFSGSFGSGPRFSPARPSTMPSFGGGA